jgi:hypothetical protein
MDGCEDKLPRSCSPRHFRHGAPKRRTITGEHTSGQNQGRSLLGTKLFLQELQKIAQPFGMLYWRLILAEAPACGSTCPCAAAKPF